MSEKRLMSSMLVAHVLLITHVLLIRVWKGLTGNPIDRGKVYFKHEVEVILRERVHTSLICQATMMSKQLSTLSIQW
jgi:hypothetical protein